MARPKEQFKKLAARFQKAKIPIETPGFYDHQNFIKIEKSNPEFLDDYARFVYWRPYDSTDLARAKRIIDITAKGIHDGLIAENRLGGCIDASMTMGRILDRYGVWNCAFKGSLRLTFAPETGERPFCFAPFDVDDGSGREYGHKWLYAPPYVVIDLTLRLQEYERCFTHLLPETVIFTQKDARIASGRPEDIIASTAIEHAASMGYDADQALAAYVPNYQTFKRDFHAYETTRPNVTLKYVPVATFASDETLEHITSFSVQGKSAYEYFSETIKPSLDAII